MAHFWLRDETKPNEKRTPLPPSHAKELLALGHRITVERSKTRIFPDHAYEALSCTMMPSLSWSEAPQDAFIFGLKELPEERTPLVHKHIYFAHCFKEQAGWQDHLARFVAGGGTLLDLEFLVDDYGRRVAAFGRWAGFAGAALGVDLWAAQQLDPSAPFPAVDAFADQSLMVRHYRTRLEQAQAKAGRKPRVMVIGANGRCGGGAIDLLKAVGVQDIVGWDLAETAKGGPFKEILDCDILVNCVLVQGKMPPFVTRAMMDGPRRLTVISDVSCDPSSPYNPIPLYTKTTTFDAPAIRVIQSPPLDITAIDHLPSLLPKESSEDFASQLMPHLKSLDGSSPVWERAVTLFREKCTQSAAPL